MSLHSHKPAHGSRDRPGLSRTMQTPTGSPPDMVAVGSKRFVPGPLAHQCANPQVVVPMTQWTVLAPPRRAWPGLHALGGLASRCTGSRRAQSRVSRESIHEHSEHQAKQYGTALRGERETTDEEPDISRLSRVARDKDTASLASMTRQDGGA